MEAPFTDATESSMYYEGDMNEPCENDRLFEFGALFTAVLNSVIFFFSIVGNSLVLWIVVKYENLSSITNIFIVNLSMTDLLFSSLLPFSAAYHFHGWVFGEILCKVMSAVFYVGFYSGIIFLTLMTIYRHVAVVHPLSALRKPKIGFCILISVIVWVVSLIAAIPVLVFTGVNINQDNFLKCEFSNVYWETANVYQQNVFILTSFVIIASCYVNVIRTLLHSPSQRKQRTVKLILLIVVVFFLSWAPYNLLIFLKSSKQLQEDCTLSQQLDYAQYVCEKVAYSHCCLNPLLYAFVGIKFQRHLKRMFFEYRTCACQQRSSNVRVTSHDNLHHDDFSLY